MHLHENARYYTGLALLGCLLLLSRTPVNAQAPSGGLIKSTVIDYTFEPDTIVARAGSKLTIRIGADTTVTAALFYRSGGMQTYRQRSLLPDSLLAQTLTVVVPDSEVTAAGLEFYLRLERGGEVVTDPAVNPAAAPHMPPVRVSPVRLNTTALRYRMAAVSVALDDPRPAAVLQTLGPPDPYKYRLFRWMPDAAGGSFLEYRNATAAQFPAFQRGNGFFLITDAPYNINLGGGWATPPDTALTLLLQPGWNMIGNPFGFALGWTAGTLDPLIGTPVSFNTQTQAYAGNQQVLQPGSGYFVYNYDQQPRTVRLTRNGASLPKTAGVTAGIGRTLSAGEWTMQTTVAAGGMEDSDTWIGVLEDAAAELDRYDQMEPPALPDMGLVYLERESLGAPAVQMTADFRRSGNEGYRWDLLVRAPDDARQIRLISTPDGQLPDGFHVRLVDLETGDVYPLDVPQAVDISLRSRGETRAFRILAGTEAFLAAQTPADAAAPDTYVLAQNYPNPFNSGTLIRYEVGLASHVRLTIYNVLGQQVRILADDEQPAGRYEVRWDGRDDEGRIAASGWYVYRLETGNGLHVTKTMLLVR